MKTVTRLALALTGFGLVAIAGAVTTDISTTPMEVGASSVVKPNVMLLFDDSGSMAWDFMPDWLSGMFSTPCVEKPYLSGGGGGGSSPCPIPSGASTIG